MVFDPKGWELPTEGDIEWSDLMAAVGMPRESSLLTSDEWATAQAENRVLTISHVGDGMQYIGSTGLSSRVSYCRAVFSRPLPDDIRVINVDIKQIDCDFSESLIAAEAATELLMEACRYGNVADAREALTAGADCKHDDCEAKSTPIRTAIQGGHYEIVRMLVDAGVAQNDRETCWRVAIASGRREIAAFLSDHDFELQPSEALLEACHAGRTDIVCDMLALIEDINESDTAYGDRSVLVGTPLTIAAGAGQLKVVQQLIDAGATPLVADSRNITPWVASAAVGSQVVCDLLESHGAVQDAQMALVVAAHLVQVEVVESLIELGVDTNARVEINGNCVTALESVIASDEIEYDSDAEEGGDGVKSKRLVLLEMLLKHGGDPNTTSEDGTPLLHQVVHHRRSECVRLLAEAGADIEATNGNGDTALIVATSLQDDAVGWLLFYGANPDVRDSNGVPALLIMFSEENEYGYGDVDAKLARYLIAFGVDLSVTEPKGRRLEQLCKRVIKNSSSDMESEPAEEILTILRDKNLLTRYHGLLAKTTSNDQDLLTQIECALEFLDDDGLAYSLVKARLKDSPNQQHDLLLQLFEQEDWRYRYAAARALDKASLATEDLIPLLLNCLCDPDIDVQIAGCTASISVGEGIVDPLLQFLETCPTELLYTVPRLIVDDIDPGRRDDVQTTLENMLPDEPEATCGCERLRSGTLLGLLGWLQADEDEQVAVALLERSVKLQPNLQEGFWGMLAAVKSRLGDSALEQAIELYQKANETQCFSEANRLLNSAMEVAPEFPWSGNNLAWSLATNGDLSLRDGQKAVKLATQLCAQDEWHYHSFLDTLAAAHAEAGNFDQAVQFTQRAIEAEPPAESECKYRDNLVRYQDCQAWPAADVSDEHDDDCEDDED